jgi:hypothetical protein
MKLRDVIQWVSTPPGPAKARQPEASLATPSRQKGGRRYVGTRANGPRVCSLERWLLLESRETQGSRRQPRPAGRVGRLRRGAIERGVRPRQGCGKDGPETWEAHRSPRPIRRSGEPVTSPRGTARLPERRAARRNAFRGEVGRARGTTTATPEGAMGVGGRHTSEDAGEPVAGDPAERRASVVERNCRREPGRARRGPGTCHRNACG